MRDILSKSVFTLAAALGTAATAQQVPPGPLWSSNNAQPLSQAPAFTQPVIIPGMRSQTINELCEQNARPLIERVRDRIAFFTDNRYTYACRFEQFAQNAPHVLTQGYLLPQDQRRLESDKKRVGLPANAREEYINAACTNLLASARILRTGRRGEPSKSMNQDGNIGCLYEYKNGQPRLDRYFNMHTPDGVNNYNRTAESLINAENNWQATLQMHRDRAKYIQGVHQKP